jgi:hypothetical protein
MTVETNVGDGFDCESRHLREPTLLYISAREREPAPRPAPMGLAGGAPERYGELLCARTAS